MNRLKLLATATLMALVFTACDEGTPPPVEPPPPPTPVGTISGSVTIEGTAAAGITATLSSGATTSTGAGGNFAFAGVEAGTYTVTISGFPEDATFAQVTQSATIASDGQNVQLNFAGEYIRSSAVVGSVVAADAVMSGGDGQPETLAGVTVTLDGEHAMGETMETGMDGGFAFTGLRAGTYTVTISDFPEDVSFETVSVEVEVDVGDVGSADFTGHYIRTSAVEGQVIIDGEGLPGVDGDSGRRSLRRELHHDDRRRRHVQVRGPAPRRLHGQHHQLRHPRLRVRRHVAGRERGSRRDGNGVVHGRPAPHLRHQRPGERRGHGPRRHLGHAFGRGRREHDDRRGRPVLLLGSGGGRLHGHDRGRRATPTCSTR